MTLSTNKATQLCPLIAKSVLISWALMLLTGITTRHLFICIYFLFSCLLIQSVTNRINTFSGQLPWKKRTAFAMSGLFTFLYLCGDFEKIIGELENILFRLFVLVVAAAGLFFLFYYVLLLLYLIIGTALASTVTKEQAAPPTRRSCRKIGIITFFACMAGWLPYLLKSYPGILTIDSMHQYAQILGIYGQSNHHPWIHTVIIKFFYSIGLLFTSDTSIAIGFYTVAQMLFMAFCVAYLIAYLHRLSIPRRITVCVACFYIFVPYNAAYSISMIKDTPFAGFVLLYTLSLLTLLSEAKNERLSLKRNFSTLCLFVVSGIFLSLFRTNGFYAFLLIVPFCFFAFRKDLKLILSAELLVIVAVLLIKGPIMDAWDVTQPDLVENLSIPGQQISRVLMNDRELTEEQAQFFDTIMDTSRLAEGYNPYVSDWFKRLVRMGNQAYLEDNLGTFFKIYIELGLKYPGDYLIAFRDQTIGYWFPFSDQAEIALNDGVVENEFGLITKPILKGPLVVKLNEILFKLHHIFPFYGLLWSVGALFWMILICMSLVFLYGDKRHLLIYLPVIGITATLLLATPVAKDFRYAYGYVFLFPVYLVVCYLSCRQHTLSK